MKRHFLLIFFAAVLSLDFLIADHCFSLEKETHKALNERIAKTSVSNFQLNSYVSSQLGFADGIETILNGKEIWKWLRDGGQYEDEPMYTRSLNHFHDPLKPWDIAGFQGTFKSSVIWAQDQGALGTLLGGDFGWKNVRNAFYNGLTSHDKDMREGYLAATFRGLGQIMHLVQDASVPAHVRNDSHAFGYHYEKAVDKFRKLGDPVFLNAIASPIIFDSSILTLPPNPLAPIPIAKIFDADQYNIGSNPPAYNDTSVGLTESTNANFLSEGTMFRNCPHPALANTSFTGFANVPITTITLPNSTTLDALYITWHGGKKLAELNYFSADIEGMQMPYLMFTLDDECYKDYARDLLPRAVGYSAGLLNYFFRGQISLVPAGDAMDQYVITNESTEALSGTFSLYYDDQQGNRIFVTRWTNIAIAPATLDEATQETTPGRSSLVTFPTPTSPAPKEKNTYLLVFRGKMGNEEGAVAGKIVRWWREEWDNGLYGNHAWVNVMLAIDPATLDQANVVNGKFIKYEKNDESNYSYSWMGYNSDSFIGRVTHANDFGPCIIGDTYSVDCAVKDQFPYPVTPKTRIHLKVDAMYVENQAGPCANGRQNGGCQEIGLQIRMGDGNTYGVHFTTLDNDCLDNQGVYIPLGKDYSATLYDVFAMFPQFITVVEPVSINYINVYQYTVIASTCNASASIQPYMEVDYIRLDEK